jgi:ribosomal protein S18 acetylase RimI-like enzyme
VAKSQDTAEVLGVLGARIRRNIGSFGRWEPAVPLEYRDSGAGEALINEAFSWLRENRVSKVTCMLRYPYSMPETGEWHMALYQNCGFSRRELVSVMLLADLRVVAMTTREIEDLHIVHADDLPLEKFVDFIRRAYMSTPEDKAVHGRDPYVSNSEGSMRIVRALKNGEYGSSPPDCWKVAMFEDEVAGFVIGFMPESKYRPLHGVIANLGVFPGFRRKGIAYLLIAEIHERFKKRGCLYSYVGTPKTNEAAIRLYRKAGYKGVFEMVTFEKTL